MTWERLTVADFMTALWSGGTTTQLAISPEGAVYADRDFLWRLSSAKVELEHSDFTPLPDYSRLLSVLSGDLELRIGKGERFPLERLTVCSFDGGTPVESWGHCVDFNLMLRKDACSGMVQSLTLQADGGLSWTAPVPAPQEYPNCTLALYCVSGHFFLAGENTEAATGELLLCRTADILHPLQIESAAGAEIMAAVIYFR